MATMPTPKKRKGNWLTNKSHEKLYNSSKWRKLSAAFKAYNPVCCIEDCTQPSAFTDHKTPVSQGGAFWDQRNWQPLCVSCNAKKTAKQ